jgi:hypothetical protein
MSFKLKRRPRFGVATLTLPYQEKVSALLIPMAESVLREPLGVVSAEACEAVLHLVQSAWNRHAIPDPKAGRVALYLDAACLNELEDAYPALWNDFTSEDPIALAEELLQYKVRHYPDDNRFIHSCWIDEEGVLRVLSTFEA